MSRENALRVTITKLRQIWEFIVRHMTLGLYKAAFLAEHHLHVLTEHGSDAQAEYERDMDDPNVISAEMVPIFLGNALIHCPGCDKTTEEVLMGLTTLESDEPSGDGLPNMVQVGVISYPCQHTFVSSALTERIASILNARDRNALELSSLVSLTDNLGHGAE